MLLQELSGFKGALRMIRPIPNSSAEKPTDPAVYATFRHRLPIRTLNGRLIPVCNPGNIALFSHPTTDKYPKLREIGGIYFRQERQHAAQSVEGSRQSALQALPD